MQSNIGVKTGQLPGLVIGHITKKACFDRMAAISAKRLPCGYMPTSPKETWKNCRVSLVVILADTLSTYVDSRLRGESSAPYESTAYARERTCRHRGWPLRCPAASRTFLLLRLLEDKTKSSALIINWLVGWLIGLLSGLNGLAGPLTLTDSQNRSGGHVGVQGVRP
jgi:hypothetical protein